MKKQELKQMEFQFDVSPAGPATHRAPKKTVEKPVENSGKTQKEQKMQAQSAEKSKKPKAPATELMKTVAVRTQQTKNWEKVFSEKELQEIWQRRSLGLIVLPDERQALRAFYIRMKHFVKELEANNKSRLIALPSLSDKGQFYKMFDFSALYYAYRLADRMGRSAKVSKDNDSHAKMRYSVSLVNMEKFKKQFLMFEPGGAIEEGEGGMIFFYLGRELTDDEVAQLKLIETTRRDRLHSIVKPKALEPEVFQAILTVVRQVAPRARKLNKSYYTAIGEQMVKNINRLLATYYDFANGIISRQEAAKHIVMLIDDLMAAVTILAEVREWEYAVSAAVGNNLNEVRRLAAIRFDIKEML